MAQDLKELFEKERKEKKYSMKSGHEVRFMDRLEEELPEAKKKSQYFWLSVAASVVLLLSLGVYLISQSGTMEQDPSKKVVDVNSSEENVIPISLGDLSPDLKKIELCYLG